ncbi:MAG TPA: aromatic ring-hydroxylating dioxygenase subunit alpha [Nocardioidaceae bacterium]|nr:aromatic ring-hydroxylating dioxygenase subunit alpha [Nocardioidaceae bacterium]
MISQGSEEARSHPLSPAELEPTLRPFGHSRMLPRAAYVDPAVFAWEQRHFFAGGWMCVGRSADVAEPGDQRAESAGNAGVLLVRGADGRLRAFANTCRHRGHELLACGESVNRRAIICPYHSWTYQLDGRLHSATSKSLAAQPDFRPECWGLAELPVREWHGLVFVDGSGRAGPFDDGVATLEAIVAPYEMERLRVADSHSYEVASNWKTLTENYHECYHCPMIHPELCRVSPPASGENYDSRGAWIGGWMDLRDGMDTMSLDGHSDGVPLRGLDQQGLRTVVYVNVFPNVLVSLHPDYAMVHRLTPLAVDRTHIECSWWFAPEAIERPDFNPAYAVDFWDITNREDWAACESVQRGLASEHAVPGPLAAEEDAVYQFVTMVARGYLGQPLACPPRAGSAVQSVV